MGVWDVKKLVILLAALASLVLTAPATAATRTIQITSTGFVPRTVTIATGDTVVWSNVDRVSHRVVVERTTCNLTIAPGSTGQCTFANTGRYPYADPNMRGNAWRGTVTVQAAPISVTIAARPLTTTYAASTTLSGRVSTGQAGQNVTIQAQVCGSTSFANVATVTTTTDGAWSVVVKPLKNTTYQARWRTATSANVAVRVRPRLTLRKLTGGRFMARVSAAQSFSGKVAVFQRFNGRTWVRVRFVVMRTITTGSPTIVSGATFRSKLRARTRIRLVMGQTQVGTCYVPTTSNTARA